MSALPGPQPSISKEALQGAFDAGLEYLDEIAEFLNRPRSTVYRQIHRAGLSEKLKDRRSDPAYREKISRRLKKHYEFKDRRVKITLHRDEVFPAGEGSRHVIEFTYGGVKYSLQRIDPDDQEGVGSMTWERTDE